LLLENQRQGWAVKHLLVEICEKSGVCQNEDFL
jgi:hypothetical protein